MARKKKDPIIYIPDNLLFDNEEVKFIDSSIINNVNPYYYGSTMGRFYTISDGKFKEMTPDYCKGYQRISLTRQDGTSVTVAVHRIIAQLFVEVPDDLKHIPIEKLEVDHKGAVRWDNRSSELQWVNHKKNMELCINGNRITDDMIIDVHRLVDEGFDDFYIAAEMSIAPSTVVMIRTGNKRFKEKLIELGLSPKYREFRVTDEAIEFIMVNVLAGKDDRTISELSGIKETTIKTIRTGQGIYTEWLAKLGYKPVLYKNDEITYETALAVYNEYASGKSEEYIMKTHHVSANAIAEIRLLKRRYKTLLAGKTPLYKEMSGPPRALSEEDAVKAHNYAKIHTILETCQKFNISDPTVLEIKHCTGPYIFLQEKYNCKPYYRSEVIKDIALEIYNDCKNGVENFIISNKYDITDAVIDDIKYCRDRFKFLKTEYGCSPLYNMHRDSVTDEIIITVMTMAINSIPDNVIAKKIKYDIDVVRAIRTGDGKFKDALERLGFEPIIRTRHSNPPQISDEEVITIYDEYRAGISAEEIAKRHNVGISTVRWIRLCFGRFKDILEKSGRFALKEQNMGSYKFTEQEAIEIYNELKTKQATIVAKERNVSENTILDIKHCCKGYVYLRDKYGLTPMYDKITKEDAVNIYHRLRNGENMKLVADEVGMTYNDIHNLQLCKQKFSYLVSEYGLSPIFTRLKNGDQY